ncbi:hypothetical protein QQZ08_007860 [Neonectria magnoliae]|uniref:Uncharacterized protein n=1 Tax=Neonectria magnoliae TaxID=2732573 RepID=A0ABR1HXW6_9HYPO
MIGKPKQRDSIIFTLPSSPSSRRFNRLTPSHYGHHTASRQPTQPAARIGRHPYLYRGHKHIGLLDTPKPSLLQHQRQYHNSRLRLRQRHQH